jgi:hypothetical protein
MPQPTTVVLHRFSDRPRQISCWYKYALGLLAAPERSQYGRAEVSSHYRQMPRQMANCNDLRTNLKAAVSLAGTTFPWPASSLSTAC